jgi:hypothetical protein
MKNKKTTTMSKVCWKPHIEILGFYNNIVRRRIQMRRKKKHVMRTNHTLRRLDVCIRYSSDGYFLQMNKWGWVTSTTNNSTPVDPSVIVLVARRAAVAADDKLRFSTKSLPKRKGNYKKDLL